MLSEEVSPKLLAAIKSPDWSSAEGLPLAPNPWSAARHWLEKRWDTDEPNEQRPPYFARLFDYLKQPIAIDDFAVVMARLYLANVGVSLGRRTAVFLVLQRVVEPRLAELGCSDVNDAIAALVGDRVPGWSPQTSDIMPLGGEFEFECLLGLFREVWDTEPDGLSVAHAIHLWFQLAFDSTRNVWRDDS